MKALLTIISLLIFFTLSVKAQVGINTTSPNGMLHLNSSTTGIIYPVVNLVDINTETITNPNGGSIIAGTTVYNNASTSVGADSVYEGIYVWDGMKWVPQFSKQDEAFFDQNTDVRTTSSGGAQSITFDDSNGSAASSFTPKYSGMYLVEVKIHYGAGAVDTPGTNNDDDVNFNAEEGVFDFTFDSNTKTVGIRSYSAENDRYSVYTNSASQARFILTETLTHGTSYAFTLTCNQSAAEGFVDNGDSGSGGIGRGYVTINNDVKCTIEFRYIGG